jgi:hypothetical protein
MYFQPVKGSIIVNYKLEDASRRWFAIGELVIPGHTCWMTVTEAVLAWCSTASNIAVLFFRRKQVAL